MQPVSRTNTQHGVTNLINHGMVKNAKPEYVDNGS